MHILQSLPQACLHLPHLSAMVVLTDSITSGHYHGLLSSTFVLVIRTNGGRRHRKLDDGQMKDVCHEGA